VKLDTMPQDSSGLALDIVSMDDESGSNRVFIFRIEKPGFLSFLPIAGNAVRGGGLATIPTSAAHATMITRRQNRSSRREKAAMADASRKEGRGRVGPALLSGHGISRMRCTIPDRRGLLPVYFW
jgi:hypothetical protein